MGKKKSRMSIFSTLVQQINEPPNDYHLIDNEYFAAFNSIDGIQQFHNKLTEKQESIRIDEDTDVYDMDMKSFAQQYLVDLPEHMNKTTENLNLSCTPTQDIFNTDQSINWSPKLKDNNSIIQSPGRFYKLSFLKFNFL
jgi:hypothetical protein